MLADLINRKHGIYRNHINWTQAPKQQVQLIYFVIFIFEGMTMIGEQIHDYQTYLKKCISASDRAFDSSGHIEHKWMSKAYRHSLKMLDKFNLTFPAEHTRESNGNPE